jgi:integrase
VRIRAFFGWCRDVKKLISISPFEAYKISSTEYGDPIYITKAERDNLYKFDLSKRPKLEIQRDIFIFQSLVGCRVGDLYRLTWDNIANDILCYTPTKTKNSTGKSPEIPLSETAKEILDKYRVQCRISGKSPLFPFISTQKYNVAIKRIFELAGLTREVPHKNPITRENEWLPLYKVASSHMARRNFVGILFEEGVDQSVIISMSGHEEGSKAFERYRKISQEKKAKAIAMLDNNAAQIDTKGLTEEQIKHINEYINSIKQNG